MATTFFVDCLLPSWEKIQFTFMDWSAAKYTGVHRFAALIPCGRYKTSELYLRTVATPDQPLLSDKIPFSDRGRRWELTTPRGMQICILISFMGISAVIPA